VKPPLPRRLIPTALRRRAHRLRRRPARPRPPPAA